MEQKLIDYNTLEWFDCENNFPPMRRDLYVDSEHGYGIGRLGKRVKDGSIIWTVHLDSGKVYLVYAFYKVKRWAYMPKEEKMSELKAGVIVTPHDEGMCFNRGSDVIAVTERETEFYLKSEADKVIAEKDAEIARLKDKPLDVKDAEHHKYKQSSIGEISNVKIL